MCNFHDSASLVVDCKSLTLGWISLSLYKVVVDSINLPILTSGEMLSHPGGWDKPIPEVIHLWRHRTSTPNNLETSRLVCILDIFCTFLGKNEKNNQSPHWGRDSGIPSSCPRFATSTTRQASSWIANLGHSERIPESFPQFATTRLAESWMLQILDTRMGSFGVDVLWRHRWITSGVKLQAVPNDVPYIFGVS